MCAICGEGGFTAGDERPQTASLWTCVVLCVSKAWNIPLYGWGLGPHVRIHIHFSLQTQNSEFNLLISYFSGFRGRILRFKSESSSSMRESSIVVLHLLKTSVGHTSALGDMIFHGHGHTSLFSAYPTYSDLLLEKLTELWKLKIVPLHINYYPPCTRTPVWVMCPAEQETYLNLLNIELFIYELFLKRCSL